MYDYIFYLGLEGAIVLVIGAAWPDKKTSHPTQSIKNWFLALGGLVMLTYSILNYLYHDGAIFFVFLQGLVNVASILMMANVKDKIDVPVISVSALALVIWSLYLFEGYSTILFVLGLAGIGLGYAMDGGTFRRNFALLLGSILIAWFSYLDQSWIFFWLNVFFALFSAYYSWKMLPKKV
ncbi:MAG: hypothetical protein AAB373_04920 [Patescibacteria group bacterium]